MEGLECQQPGCQEGLLTRPKMADYGPYCLKCAKAYRRCFICGEGTRSRTWSLCDEHAKGSQAEVRCFVCQVKGRVAKGETTCRICLGSFGHERLRAQKGNAASSAQKRNTKEVVGKRGVQKRGAQKKQGLEARGGATTSAQKRNTKGVVGKRGVQKRGAQKKQKFEASNVGEKGEEEEEEQREERKEEGEGEKEKEEEEEREEEGKCEKKEVEEEEFEEGEEEREEEEEQGEESEEEKDDEEKEEEIEEEMEEVKKAEEVEEEVEDEEMEEVEEEEEEVEEEGKCEEEEEEELEEEEEEREEVYYVYPKGARLLPNKELIDFSSWDGDYLKFLKMKEALLAPCHDEINQFVVSLFIRGSEKGRENKKTNYDHSVSTSSRIRWKESSSLRRKGGGISQRKRTSPSINKRQACGGVDKLLQRRGPNLMGGQLRRPILGEGTDRGG